MEQMLAAPVVDLAKPDLDTPLGRHLATCARCAAAARLVVDETRALAAELAAEPQPGEAARVVEAVLSKAAVLGEAIGSRASTHPPGVAAGPEAAEPESAWSARGVPGESVRPDAGARPAGARASRTGLGVRRRDLSWLGLAAAAAVAALLFRPPAIPRGDGLLLPQGEPDPGIFEAAPGADVAVLPTRDPDITVIWFFPTRSDR